MFGRKKREKETKQETGVISQLSSGALGWMDAISAEVAAHLPLGEFLDAVSPENAETILGACALTRTRTLGTLGPRAQAALISSISAVMPVQPAVDYDLDEPDDLLDATSNMPKSDTPESDAPESDTPEQDEEELA